MWTDRRKKLPAGKALWAGFGFMFILVSAGCAGAQGSRDTDGSAADTGEAMKAELVAEMEEPVAGLLLTSRDAEENEAVILAMEEMAEENGARLVVYTPDVSAREAEEAGDMEMGSFASCDVNPVEYQMLGVNQFAAEGVDVMAVHANHSEALESVLAAARGIGIRICAWGREVSEGSFDIYVETAEEVPEAVLELLQAGEQTAASDKQ